jgi:drug/metabolite transporter (DMT)-like permease
MKKVAVSEEDINDNIATDTIVLELNEVILPNPEENNGIKTSSFVAVKTRKKSIEKAKNQIDLERTKIQKKISKKRHLFLLALAIIYLIPMVLDAFNQYTFKTSSAVSLFFSIISYVIFGRLILGMKIYSHQIFSLIIILVSNVTIVLLIFIGRKNENIVLSLVFIFAIVVLFCLYNNLVKKYFNVYMGSPYYLMFIIGLISICLILPYEIITVIAFGKDTSFNGIFYQMQKNFENNKLP